jgi:ferric-dicitrate binding protein FerR (iron transport regulator)
MIPEQSKAFIEKAREIEADEKHSAADKPMERLAKTKPEPRKPSRRTIFYRASQLAGFVLVASVWWWSLRQMNHVGAAAASRTIMAFKCRCTCKVYNSRN